MAQGSFGLISNRNDLMNFVVASGTGSPMARPTAVIAKTSRRTIQISFRRSAPSAIRSPISYSNRRFLICHFPPLCDTHLLYELQLRTSSVDVPLHAVLQMIRG